MDENQRDWETSHTIFRMIARGVGVMHAVERSDARYPNRTFSCIVSKDQAKRVLDDDPCIRDTYGTSPYLKLDCMLEC